MDIKVKNLQSKISIPVFKIQSAAQKVVHELRRKGALPYASTDISIVFVGTRRMRSINKKFLNHDYVTDVITFDLEGACEILICPHVAGQNARIYGLSIEKELLLYVIHGLLHLAGYDDHSLPDIKRMRLKEQQLLDKIYD